MRPACVVAAIVLMSSLIVSCRSDVGQTQRTESTLNAATLTTAGPVETSVTPMTREPVETSAVVTSVAGSATTLVPSSLMSVGGPIVAGDAFVVAFSGRLRQVRGGYMSVSDSNGRTVASLRSDGNPQIPMAYQLGSRSDMLADGLSGDQSTFIFPSELSAGRYTLCTTNSGPTQCVSVVVQTPSWRSLRSARLARSSPATDLG